MLNIFIQAAQNNNVVRTQVRYTIEEDTITGHVSKSWTQDEDIHLVGGTILGKTEILTTIWGQKVTTMVVEGLDGLNLNLATDTSERDSVFGTNSTVIVRIQSSVEAMMGDAHSTLRTARPMPGRPVTNISVSVRKAPRPTTRFRF
jgi:hypothetical protein